MTEHILPKQAAVEVYELGPAGYRWKVVSGAVVSMTRISHQDPDKEMMIGGGCTERIVFEPSESLILEYGRPWLDTPAKRLVITVEDLEEREYND